MLLDFLLNKFTKLIIKFYSSKQLYNMYSLKIIEESNHLQIEKKNKLISSYQEDYEFPHKLRQRN